MAFLMADLAVSHFLAGLIIGFTISVAILVPLILLLVKHQPKRLPDIGLVIGPVSEQRLSEQFKKEK